MTEPMEAGESRDSQVAGPGGPDAEEHDAKAVISRVIAAAIKARGLTQAQAAELLGTRQPEVSAVVRGQVSGFTLDRLFRFLTALGISVRVEVDSSGGAEQGHLQVRAS